MGNVPREVLDIAERLRRNEPSNPRSVRTLLEWFGDYRRGKAVVSKIQEALLSAGLATEPDFEKTGIDDEISFRLTSRMSKDVGIATSTESSSSLMTKALNDIPRGTLVEEPSDDFLEPELDEEEAERADDQPVVSTPADWTITALREKWDAGLLDLQPRFQREYVWRLKPELPARLIESVLLEIPIPPLYFGRLEGGRLEVIDGQQRLTTLIDFITNEFRLQRLTRMPSLNGLQFRDLSVEFQEKIKDTPIRTVVINAGRNTELRYEIFERLNRGSMGLNEQELRNCVYRGPFNDLLATLESDRYWRDVKGGADPEPRFKEREMILRFFALANRGQFYKGALKRFLNEYMASHAPRDAPAIAEQTIMFEQTMRNVSTVFGANAGRLYSIQQGGPDGSWDKKFSIAALEIQASALLGQEHAKVQKVADQIQEHFLFLLLTDETMREAISRATSGSSATRLRWSKFKSIVEPLLANVHVEPRFFSSEFRRKMYDENPTCKLCGGNRIHRFDDSTVDHITPYSRGGKTIPENAQLAHRWCNSQKHAKLAQG